MTPDSMANEVEEQKLLLKQYLGQYYYAKMKRSSWKPDFVLSEKICSAQRGCNTPQCHAARPTA